jgi:predicted RNA binding protein YcfA (HicA-like mRNA interferase family)
MERNSRKLIRMLEQDGWVLDRVNGDHHTFKHPNKEKIITSLIRDRICRKDWCGRSTSSLDGDPDPEALT